MADATRATPSGPAVGPTRKKSRRGVPLRARLLRVISVGLTAPSRSTRRASALRGADAAPVDATAHAPAQASVASRFDRFYRTNYPSVVRLAYSLCGSMPIAEELAQEAFVSAHQRWNRIAAYERPDLWVRRAVINRSISYRRREATERRALDRVRVQTEHVLASKSDPVVSDELVWQALRELSPRQAEVLALFYVEDQPLAAVAEILGLGPETVKTHLKRGRAALAARLSELGHVR